MKPFLNVLILLITSFAIYGTFGLVKEEWAVGNICPKILGIPACYIVLVGFTFALLSHFYLHTKAHWGFFFFIGIITAIATTGTIGELTGLANCPRTTGGTPMCFISLAICLTLLASKIALIKIK